MRHFWKLCALLLIGALLLAGCGSEKTAQPQADTKTQAQVEMSVPQDGVPVLMYHMIGVDKNDPDNEAVLSEEHFKEQMKYLKDHDYHPLTMQQFYDYLVHHKPVPVRPVLLTFDDGYPDTYSIVMPVLKEYGFDATVFVPTYDVDQGTRLNWQQVQEMKDSGLTIASHSYKHERTNEMPGSTFAEAIEKSQAELKDKLGLTNEWFCYPYGGYTEDAGKVLKKAGIKLAFTMDPGWAKYGDNPYAVKRIWIGNPVDLDNFAQRLSTPHYEQR